MIVVQPLDFIYKLKFKEVAIFCKQLSYRQRSIIGAKHVQQKSGANVQDVVGLLFEVLKHSIKRVEGFKNPDGSDYQLRFDGEALADDCLEEILHVEDLGDILQGCASNFLNMREPGKILNPQTGEPYDDVSIIKEPDSKKK